MPVARAQRLTRVRRDRMCCDMAGYWLKYRESLVPIRTGKLTIGRSACCSIILRTNSVSRAHCSVERVGSQVSLKDLGSSNGTFVNGERVVEVRELSPGDRIQIGREVLDLVLLEDEPCIPTAGRDSRRTAPEMKVSEPRSFEQGSSEPTTDALNMLELLESVVSISGIVSYGPESRRHVWRMFDNLLDAARRAEADLSPDERRRIAAIIAQLDGGKRNA